MASTTSNNEVGNSPDRALVCGQKPEPTTNLEQRTESLKGVSLYSILVCKWCSVLQNHDGGRTAANASLCLRRAGLYQTLWYCHRAASTRRFHYPLGIALINDRMVRVFVLEDGSYAVEFRDTTSISSSI